MEAREWGIKRIKRCDIRVPIPPMNVNVYCKHILTKQFFKIIELSCPDCCLYSEGSLKLQLLTVK